MKIITESERQVEDVLATVANDDLRDALTKMDAYDIGISDIIEFMFDDERFTNKNVLHLLRIRGL